MLTNFGKELRKIRIDKGELLKDMAKKLNVTVAYLSAVENGNREIPDNWLNIIADEYNLTTKEYVQLQEFAYETKKVMKFDMTSMCKEDKELVLSFARRFRNLNDEEFKVINNLLNRDRSDDIE